MNNKFLLEQSEPCRPVSQEQSPEDVSQTPELLQSAGQVNSINKNHYDLMEIICFYIYKQLLTRAVRTLMTFIACTFTNC